MKMHEDNNRNVKPHNIRVGDLVLLKRKTTKKDSPYDPDPYLVTSVWGTQIQGERHGKKKTRDAQRWKKLEADNRPRRRPHLTHEQDADVGAGETKEERTNRAEEPILEVEEPHQAEEPILEVEEPHQEANEDNQPDEVLQQPATAIANATNIMQALRNHPDVIVSGTVANRPTRSKIPIRRYEPVNWKKKSK